MSAVGTGARLKYSVDSSSLITAWNGRYPIDVFPGLWSRLSNAIRDEQTVKITEAVYEELKHQRDELFEWIDSHGSYMVVPFDTDIQKLVIDIQSNYPTLVDIENDRDFADPFVIALAKINGCNVITEEIPTGLGARRLKIPNVCLGMSIQHSNFLGMVRSEAWTF